MGGTIAPSPPPPPRKCLKYTIIHRNNGAHQACVAIQSKKAPEHQVSQCPVFVCQDRQQTL